MMVFMKTDQIILITGCAGQLGSLIAKHSYFKEYSLVGLDIRPPNGEIDYPFYKVDLSHNESLKHCLCEISEKFGHRIASVVHLAGYYSHMSGEWDKHYKSTVKSTSNLLQLLSEFEVEQFLFISTMNVHAPCKPTQRINENGPLLASWEFPKSKILAEEIIKAQRGNIPAVVLRTGSWYDNRCNSVPLSRQIQRIYENRPTAYFFPGNLYHGFPYLHLDDLQDAIVQLVEKRNALPEEFTALISEEKSIAYTILQSEISNLLFGKEIPTFKIPKWVGMAVAKCLEYLPVKEVSFYKPWMADIADLHYALDLNKVKSAIDWQPKRNLFETLPLIIQTLQENPIQFYREHNLKMPSWLKKLEVRQVSAG